jgi:hypothetical protein
MSETRKERTRMCGNRRLRRRRRRRWYWRERERKKVRFREIVCVYEKGRQNEFVKRKEESANLKMAPSGRTERPKIEVEGRV